MGICPAKFVHVRFQLMPNLFRFVVTLCFLLACEPRCLAQSEPAPTGVQRISDELRSRNFTEALNLSKAALATEPNNYRIWTLRGMATAGTGDLPAALTAYQHALKLAPAFLPALEGAAQSEFEMGHDAAEPFILRVLAQHPDDPTSHAMLGALEYRKKDCSDAVTHFQKAAAVIASQAAALTEYGACLTIVKQDEDAVAVFEEALALDPSKRDARYNLAVAQWNAQHADDALAALQPLIETMPVDVDGATLAAEILESGGDTSQAIELLRKAILASPSNVIAYLQFATISYDHASPQVGIDILNAGLTQLPKEPRLYLVRGVLLTQLGEFARAADDFETADRIDPQLSFLGVAEGLVESQQHKSAEALAEFRAAVKAHPNEAYASYLLAEALQELGRPAGSAEYKEEIDAATRAVKLDPELVTAHDLLSAVYLANGRNDMAIEQSRIALALDANDQQAVYHLIVALRNSEQKDRIPALLKRLMTLRANDKSEQTTNKRYRLYEVPAATGNRSP
jgi:tetratricopeptide (TPR) repeat protein